MKIKDMSMCMLVLFAFVLLLGGALATPGRAETGKTDRTLIKELLEGQKAIQQNQRETLQLLKDIKRSFTILESQI